MQAHSQLSACVNQIQNCTDHLILCHSYTTDLHVSYYSSSTKHLYLLIDSLITVQWYNQRSQQAELEKVKLINDHMTAVAHAFTGLRIERLYWLYYIFAPTVYSWADLSVAAYSGISTFEIDAVHQQLRHLLKNTVTGQDAVTRLWYCMLYDDRNITSHTICSVCSMHGSVSDTL